jgi:hypothetical protein
MWSMRVPIRRRPTPGELGAQEPPQHARAGEGEVQVQRIDLPHQREIPGRDGPGHVVHGAAACRVTENGCDRAIIAWR